MLASPLHTVSPGPVAISTWTTFRVSLAAAILTNWVTSDPILLVLSHRFTQVAEEGLGALAEQRGARGPARVTFVKTPFTSDMATTLAKWNIDPMTFVV